MPGPCIRVVCVALAIALALGSAGCRKRKSHTAPPVVITPVPATAGTEPAPPPETKTEPEPAAPAPPAPPKLVVPAPKPPPAKPQPATPAPEAEAPKPPPPQLSPRLTPAQQAEYERAARLAISTSEKNLQRAYGKTLNTAQRDLEAKIRGFLEQAHEAIRAADWVRARNLAEKAQVLSVELVNSL